MVTIKLEENQNLFDAAIQEYGSIEGLFELLEVNLITDIALENEVSVYDDLKVNGLTVKRNVIEYYIAREKKPATALTDKEIELLVEPKECEGIGCMEIEDDFIVYDPQEEPPLTCIEEHIYSKRGEGIGSMIISEDNIVR